MSGRIAVPIAACGSASASCGGSAIACLYHGWQYDAAGRCRVIPAHPALKAPSTIAATTYDSAERLGLVWVSLGSAAAPPGDNAATTPVRSLAVQAPVGLVLAALAAPEGSPFATQAPLVCERSGPLVSVRAGEERLIAAVQALSDAETTVHIVLAGAPAVSRRRAGAGVAVGGGAAARAEAASVAAVAEAAWAREAVA